MISIQNEFREKFKKSDALKDLKEVAEKMTKEEFIDFSDSAMKSAYDKNRTKAVDYMLSFYEQNKPQLLLRIHLQCMLADEKVMKSGEKMLKVLNKNFTLDFACEIMDNFINFHQGKQIYKNRKTEILKILLEETLVKNIAVTKKLKI